MNTTPAVRVASVGFCNARPLIAGLGDRPGVSLSLHVPADLLAELESRRADVALLPTIDLQRLPGLAMIPAGAIGCDGPTLTVRLFSKSPIEQTKVLACDPDSHTSVALARIIFEKRFGLRPEFVDLRRATGSPFETKLLIGDKVVCEEPPDMPHQLDLGQAWKELTGLPFVFAIWTCFDEFDASAIARELDAARVRGVGAIDSIVATHAVPRGWPAELARRYFTEYLRFDVGPRQVEAISLFHRLASELGVIENAGPIPVKPC